MAMAGARQRICTLVSCIVVLILVSVYPCQSAPSTSGHSWRTARSLSSSLLHRIANHRVAKGDVEGADRIKHILSSLDGGFSLWRNVASLSWDYIIHYSWRSWNTSQIFDTLRLLADIQSALTEFRQLSNEMDRLQWISANYNRVLKLATLTLQNLLKRFDQPGPLRNLMLSMQTEILGGGILQDAMQLGAGDLQGLIQVAKDILRRYYGQTSTSSSSEL